ncbi:hypothetical protein ABFT80_16970 [Mesorhizobium sp. SB112]|jgi:cell division septum initiation protein DivIVA|uniref:DUF883 family protein n=1 Tax=Mesorhizobium sp. SB112 TaxID=3151853 RepID=UPI003263A3AF
MASTFSKIRDDLDLEDQLKSLRKEIASLKKAAGKRGAHAYDDAVDVASDFYDEARARFNDALPHIKKRARDVEQTARDNPAATAIVGLVVAGLLVSFFSRR